MAEYHLAQLNIASMAHALDAPEMADFVSELPAINALADAAPGFVWRLQGEAGDATCFDRFGPDYLLNMSVWENDASLQDYVYRSAHKQILARRREWLKQMQEAYSVLWWISAGSLPALEQAELRLLSLRSEGPNPRAFTFKQLFEPR